MCATCQFFCVDKEDSRYGQCRRNPPIVSTLAFSGAFPRAKPSDWCGEYEQTDEPNVHACGGEEQTPFGCGPEAA